MTTSSMVALAAGMASVLYAPVATVLLTRDRAIKSIIAWSTIVGAVISVLTALQIHCMVVGGCRSAAWLYALTIAAAAVLYMYVVTRSLLSARRAREASGGDESAAFGRDAVGARVPPQVVAHPVYGMVQSVRESRKAES